MIVVAILAGASLFLDAFKLGVLDLGKDVQAILSGDATFGDAYSNGHNGGGDGVADDGPWGMPGGAPSTGGSDDGSSSDDGGEPPEDGGADDSGSDDGSDGEDEDEDEQSCPYVYDEASGRWRDPETGQYVSYSDAAAAGC